MKLFSFFIPDRNNICLIKNGNSNKQELIVHVKINSETGKAILIKIKAYFN